MNRRGFTVIELVVVVVIVAVLAAIAIPLYARHVKYGRLTEATARIGEIATAARTYAVEHPAPDGSPTWPSGSAGIVDLSSSPNFTYAFTEGSATDAWDASLEITAVGIPGRRMAGVRVKVKIPRVDMSATPPSVTGL